ncbi:MAG: DUF1015 family protein [Bacteroidota bacterium]|nr:DUF1015 family protein [Bacteroidota bacterium]
MANIFPFVPLIVNDIDALEFTTPSAEIESLIEENQPLPEFCYQQILNPQLFQKIGEDKDRTQTSIENFNKFLNEQVLLPNQTEGIYIYRQQTKNNTYHSIIALTSLGDYKDSRIKKHEHTRHEKEEKMTQFFRNVRINGNPVLLTYRPHESIDTWIRQQIVSTLPTHSFSSTERQMTHDFWFVSELQLIQEIKHLFKQVPELYIADGHHRCASLVKMYPEVDKFLTCLISSTEMNIYGYHRYVKDLGVVNRKELIKTLIDSGFLVEELQEPSLGIEGVLNLYIKKRWYSITIPQHLKDDTDIKHQLDVYILDKYIFGSILHITDTRTSDRLKFVPGNLSLDELISPIKEGSIDALFLLQPIKPEYVFNISDVDDVMPVKSTWIEPKMRNGLLIHHF